MLLIPWIDDTFIKALFNLSLIFWVIIISLLVSSLLVQSYQKRQNKRHKRVLTLFNDIIEKAVLVDKVVNDESLISDAVSKRLQKVLRRKDIRKWFIHELIIARTNISGFASENLKKLYIHLRFHKASLHKLNSRKWRLKAIGIQELCLMEQMDYMEEVFKYSNHPNEYVRMEAQLGLIRANGFDSFSFLNKLTQNINRWNHIRLLAQVSQFSYPDFTGIDRWLQSSNVSVVFFSLRLIEHYHIFKMHDEVVSYLTHPNEKIAIAALQALSSIYDENTTEQIIPLYKNKSHNFQMTSLKTLEIIGSPKTMSFLMREWQSDKSPDIKIAAARAIASSSTKGIVVLQETPEYTSEPGYTIVQQVKAERK